LQLANTGNISLLFLLGPQVFLSVYTTDDFHPVTIIQSQKYPVIPLRYFSSSPYWCEHHQQIS